MMDKKGDILIITVTIFFVVIVLYSLSSFVSLGGFKQTTVGVDAAIIKELSSRGDLDLFAVEKSFDVIKFETFKKLGRNFDVSKKFDEQYIGIFKESIEDYLKDLYFGLSQQFDYDYEIEKLEIKDNKLVLKVKLKYLAGNVDYKIGKEFISDIDLSVFEGLDSSKCFVSKSGGCGAYDNVCGECIDSSGDNYLNFELKTMFLGEEIPIKYKVDKF